MPTDIELMGCIDAGMDEFQAGMMFPTVPLMDIVEPFARLKKAKADAKAKEVAKPRNDPKPNAKAN